LCRLFGLRFIQLVPGGMQLFPGPACLFLCLMNLIFLFTTGFFPPGSVSIVCPALLSGALRFPATRFPALRCVLLPHTVRRPGLVVVLPEFPALWLRAMLARSSPISLRGVLVLKAEPPGGARGFRAFPYLRVSLARSFLWRFLFQFLTDGLRPLFRLPFLVLGACGHNGVELRVLREVVYKRNGRIPEKQKPFAGIGVRHIGKLVGADPKLLRQNLA